MTGLAIFYGDVQDSMLSIQFFIIQYGLTFIDFLMVLGAKNNIKEFIYVWITTTLLEILILFQQIGTMLWKIRRWWKSHDNAGQALQGDHNYE